jgi:hypothetical protein
LVAFSPTAGKRRQLVAAPQEATGSVGGVTKKSHAMK